MPRFLGIDTRLLTICSFVAIILTVSLIISMAIPASELTFPFVHAAVEALGSFFAIVVAWHSLTAYAANQSEAHRVWIGLAFLNMGILYGFHALVAPGDLSIWFRSCATLIGGVLSMLVWFPSQTHRKVPVGWAVIICLSAYSLLGIVSFRNQEILPPMIDQREMTWITTCFTVSGGTAFLGSAVWFLRHLKHSSHWEPVRQASCYASIGISEIFFTWSTVWDPMWWWWHGVRLFSYGIVAYSAKMDFDKGLVRQTEVAMQEEENARFRLIVESAPCGMLMVGSNGTISMVNPQLEVVFGYDRNELIGHSINTLLPERFRTTPPGIEELYTPTSHQAGVWKRKELFGLRKDGTECPIEVGFSPVELGSGKQALVMVLDITERKGAEQQLERQTAELSRSNHELEQFAYVASHDLQEPLRMVSSYCGLLARRYKGKIDQDADEFIQFAIDGAARMKGLIDGLLMYSRVGRQEKPFVLIDAGESMQAALANLEIAVKETGASIICEALPQVLANPVQLAQVFQNLIGNALKFRGNGRPVIHVAARNPGKRGNAPKWIFSIQDNGIGFEPQFQERVFEIFQRLHTREEYTGNGMGLAITKKIIERHGGTIWAESMPGSGTTFFFTLRGHVLERFNAAA